MVRPPVRSPYETYTDRRAGGLRLRRTRCESMSHSRPWPAAISAGFVRLAASWKRTRPAGAHEGADPATPLARRTWRASRGQKFRFVRAETTRLRTPRRSRSAKPQLGESDSAIWGGDRGVATLTKRLFLTMRAAYYPDKTKFLTKGSPCRSAAPRPSPGPRAPAGGDPTRCDEAATEIRGGRRPHAIPTEWRRVSDGRPRAADAPTLPAPLRTAGPTRKEAASGGRNPALPRRGRSLRQESRVSWRFFSIL